MTSYFARYGALRPDTQDAYTKYNDTLHDRVYFYFLYFEDIVPQGVTVRHIWNSSSNDRTPTQELQLLTPSEHIFMTGLVSMVLGKDRLKTATKRKARWYYRHAYYADDDGCWRYFTALTEIRNFNGYYDYENESHEFIGTCHPISDVAAQAQNLQRYYDSMRTH